MSKIAFLEEGALTSRTYPLVVPPTKDEWEEFRRNLVLPEYITHVGVLFELGKEEALQHTWKVSLSLSDWRLIAQVGQGLELYERFRGSIYVKVVDYCQDIISEKLENNEEPRNYRVRAVRLSAEEVATYQESGQEFLPAQVVERNLCQTN
jgi:hypothetical protein